MLSKAPQYKSKCCDAATYEYLHGKLINNDHLAVYRSKRSYRPFYLPLALASTTTKPVVSSDEGRMFEVIAVEIVVSRQLHCDTTL